MTPEMKGSLTILASGILAGSAGFWLLPNQMKGAVVGAVAGSATAAAHIQQMNRLRKLAIAHQSDSTHLRNQIMQAARTIESVGLETESQKAIVQGMSAKIDHKSQPSFSPKLSTSADISSLSRRLSTLELKLDRNLARVGAGQEKSQPYPSPLLLAEPQSSIPQSFSIEERAETSEDEAVQKITEWFEKKQVEVENYYEPDPQIDRLLDGLSLYLGDNYSSLKMLHWKLRSSVGKKTTFDLSKCSTRIKSIHKEYINKLKSSDYLSIGRLVIRKDNSSFIVAESHQRSDIQGFFDGGWFERYIYDKVVELLDAEGADYQYLRNLKIAYSSSDKAEPNIAELDLFFLVNGQPLLIECKTGSSHTKGIAKFNKHREKLGLDMNSAVFVVLDIDEAEAHLRTTNWGATVTNQNDFLARIKERITASRPSLPSLDEDEESEAAEEVGLVDLGNESLESFFKIIKINLAPKSRRRVLESLIQLMEASKEPTTFNQISKALRDHLKDELSLSRHKISEILNCLRVTKLFRNEDNRPVINTAKPIYKMTVLNVDFFERKCVEYYTKKILTMYDPGFFNTAENIALFETLTQSKTLFPEEIEQIRERQLI